MQRTDPLATPVDDIATRQPSVARPLGRAALAAPADRRAEAVAQREVAQAIASSPRQAAQLRQLRDAFGPDAALPIVQPKNRTRRVRGVPLALGVPDVGGHLNTLQTPGHPTFANIVIFTLNNQPGFNELHVHRNAAGVVLQVSKKQTGQPGNGTPVPGAAPLFAAAVAAAANH